MVSISQRLLYRVVKNNSSNSTLSYAKIGKRNISLIKTPFFHVFSSLSFMALTIFLKKARVGKGRRGLNVDHLELYNMHIGNKLFSELKFSILKR